MNPFNYSVKELAKAITGAVIAGLTALGVAITDNNITGAEAVTIALAVVITFAGVFGVSNSGGGSEPL